MIKVEFTNPFYGPVPGMPDTSKQYLPKDMLPEGADGAYEFPDDYPLPSSAIVIEGTPTYKKPADQSPAPVTEIKPSAITKTGKRTKAAAA